MVYGQHKIKWGALTKNKAQELGVKLLIWGTWKSIGDASAMWTTIAYWPRKVSREVLGVLKGYSDSHKGD